jgi:hypothetical protein
MYSDLCKPLIFSSKNIEGIPVSKTLFKKKKTKLLYSCAATIYASIYYAKSFKYDAIFFNSSAPPISCAPL